MGSTRRDDQIPGRVVTHTRNPAQRVFHVLVSVLAWVLFGFFWYTIFVRGMDRQAATAVLLILVVLAGIILVNSLWVYFNRSLYRKLGPRVQVREVVMSPTADKLGRPLLGAEWESLKTSCQILVDLDGPSKVYRSHTPHGPPPPDSVAGPRCEQGGRASPLPRRGNRVRPCGTGHPQES